MGPTSYASITSVPDHAYTRSMTPKSPTGNYTFYRRTEDAQLWCDFFSIVSYRGRSAGSLLTEAVRQYVKTNERHVPRLNRP